MMVGCNVGTRFSFSRIKSLTHHINKSSVESPKYQFICNDSDLRVSIKSLFVISFSFFLFFISVLECNCYLAPNPFHFQTISNVLIHQGVAPTMHTVMHFLHCVNTFKVRSGFLWMLIKKLTNFMSTHKKCSINALQIPSSRKSFSSQLKNIRVTANFPPKTCRMRNDIDLLARRKLGQTLKTAANHASFLKTTEPHRDNRKKSDGPLSRDEKRRRRGESWEKSAVSFGENFVRSGCSVSYASCSTGLSFSFFLCWNLLFHFVHDGRRKDFTDNHAVDRTMKQKKKEKLRYVNGILSSRSGRR